MRPHPVTSEDARILGNDRMEQFPAHFAARLPDSSESRRHLGAVDDTTTPFLRSLLPGIFLPHAVELPNDRFAMHAANKADMFQNLSFFLSASIDIFGELLFEYRLLFLRFQSVTGLNGLGLSLR